MIFLKHSHILSHTIKFITYIISYIKLILLRIIYYYLEKFYLKVMERDISHLLVGLQIPVIYKVGLG